MGLAERVMQKLDGMAPVRVNEVLDFIRFIKQQDAHDFPLQAAETALKEFWDDPQEDEVWKNL